MDNIAEDVTNFTKINDIDSFLNYKISIKTMIGLGSIWGILMIVCVIILLGGIDNTIEVLKSLFNITKNTVKKINK
jgi:hypothetical protein